MRAVATWVVVGGATTTRCATYGDSACVDTLLGWLPREAFRRSVSDLEISKLRTLFDELDAGYEYDYAFAGIVRAVLLSPDFLYLREKPGKQSSEKNRAIGHPRPGQVPSAAVGELAPP